MSSGMPHGMKDYTGWRKGHLVAEEFADRDQDGALWWFRCDCGNRVLRKPSKLGRYRKTSKIACTRECSAKLERNLKDQTDWREKRGLHHPGYLAIHVHYAIE